MNALTIKLGIALALVGANSAFGVTNTLQSVSPGSAAQGTSGLVVTFTLAATPPAPPTNVAVGITTIGTIVGSAMSRPTSNTVSGTFNIPGGEPPGTKDVLIRFGAGGFLGHKAAGFTVTEAPLAANFTSSPTNGVAPLAVNFTDNSTGTVADRLWDFGDGSTSGAIHPVHTFSSVGSYTVSLTVFGVTGSNTLIRTNCITITQPPANGLYVIVDTGQTNCYSDSGVITPPASGQLYYGQDAQIAGRQPAYTNNGDGTITDLNTGLIWVQARGSEVSWAAAFSNAVNCRIAGYTDWRVPTIKELYSLVKFTGANGPSMTNAANYIPFIDTNYFGFTYGGNSTEVGSRIIDAQDWSATAYVSTTVNGSVTIFGHNFTDGRLKGYPRYDAANNSILQSNYVRYVRGNPGYGINSFVNHGDGTISDKATRLMWARNDNGVGMNWSNALAWVQRQNSSNYLGHQDWRLPNAKELHSLLDYTRSPDTTASAAINPIFNCTGITNELNQPDFPWYWTSTTLMDGPFSASGVYLCFGRAMGYMGGGWVDAHGAGAQRSDLKSGSLTNNSKYTYVPYGFYSSLAPQGDAIRIANHIRLVRDIPLTNSWRFAFVGDTHTPLTTIPSEIASAVINDDAKLLIVAGDLVESGAAVSTNTLASQLATWRSAFAPVTAAGIPIHVIRGNHEDDVNNDLPTWNTFFSGAYAMPGNGPTGESNLTYSFTTSNALFIALDEYVNIHRINQSWLAQLLATHTRPHLFVFGHEPAFKAFHTDCLDDYPAERNVFWDCLAAAGARVYLCGHDHFYNVARIDDGDGNPANDLYQFIVGTGGSTNWPINRYNYNGTNAPYTPVNVAAVTNTYGYLLVEISGPGSNDLGVTLTWKQRTYDADTGSYLYVATNRTLSYAAVNRSTDSVGDGISDAWRSRYFGGGGTTTNASSCAICDPDHDGVDNAHEYLADTNPTNALSRFQIQSVANAAGLRVFFESSPIRTYTLYYRTNLSSGPWTNVPTQTGIPGSGGVDVLTDPLPVGTQRFYRIGVQRP